MAEDPLAIPEPGSPVAAAFLRHAGITPRAPDAALLEQAARAFSALPFENLTKVIRLHEEGAPERARRGPAQVLEDHLRLGTGGTCFSLTALFLHIVRALGFSAEPVLADRPYGPDTHSALLVALDGRPHLVDPGYLVFTPVPVPTQGETRIATPFNDIVLTPSPRGTLDLATCQSQVRKHRMTFKLPGADPAEFLRAWHASFSWDMMRYPLLTRVTGGVQRYLQKHRFQERRREGAAHRALAPEDLAATIAREFAVAPAVVARALDILHRKEPLHA